MSDSDFAVDWHPAGYSTTDPFRAHRELSQAGYRQVPPTAASGFSQPPAGPVLLPRPDAAVRLYRKDGYLYWLVVE